jgi:hypothetical protein
MIIYLHTYLKDIKPAKIIKKPISINKNLVRIKIELEF